MPQKVLITAGAAGIGLAMARAFSASGSRVFICDIDEDAIALAAKEITGLITHICDVSDNSAVEKMVAICGEILGGIDVLVNNAGIAGPTAPVEDISPEDWENVIRVDINATFYVTRAAIPFLKKSSAGVIINMSSMAGRMGYENRSPYSTSKWALIGFTKTLSIELGKYGIRVNAILPGPVDGPRIERVMEGRAKANHTTVEQEKENALSVQSIKQFVDPKDIAALALFLASDSAKMISGQMIPIDGDIQKAS